DFSTATRELDTAVELAGSDFQLLGKIYNNKAYLSLRRSEADGLTFAQRMQLLEQSAEEHLTAIYFTSSARDEETLQILENNMAVHYARMGERRKSLLHFLNVQRILEQSGGSETRAGLYANLSTYFQT